MVNQSSNCLVPAQKYLGEVKNKLRYQLPFKDNSKNKTDM